MKFTAKHFDPEARGGILQSDGRVAFRSGDRPEDLHVYDQKTILALNVALATRRPLLISGEPGSGKSTLARSAAAVLGHLAQEKRCQLAPADVVVLGGKQSVIENGLQLLSRHFKLFGHRYANK